MKTSQELENLVKQFKENQTLTNLQPLKNNGIELYKMSWGKWERIAEYKLPIERFIRLYNDKFILIGIGYY